MNKHIIDLPEIPMCIAEGCDNFATAFLIKTRKNVLTGEVQRTQEGYCIDHAVITHDDLTNNNPNYQHESFEHPDKL